ncbi:MAG: type II toxin-antitoxin system VapC family toxin [Spirochaetaceae bacterium]
MIIPDINLLVYAYNADSPEHPRAKKWWENALNSPLDLVGLPTAVLLGFIRIMTHPRIFPNPLYPSAAVSYAQSWLARPNVEPLAPGPNHFGILKELLDSLGTAGPLTTDAHIAAFAVETGAVVYSNDTDFFRFPGIRTENPL